MSIMSKPINAKISTDAKKSLDALCKVSGLTQGEVLSQLLERTGVDEFRPVSVVDLGARVEALEVEMKAVKAIMNSRTVVATRSAVRRDSDSSSEVRPLVAVGEGVYNFPVTENSKMSEKEKDLIESFIYEQWREISPTMPIPALFDMIKAKGLGSTWKEKSSVGRFISNRPRLKAAKDSGVVVDDE